MKFWRGLSHKYFRSCYWPLSGFRFWNRLPNSSRGVKRTLIKTTRLTGNLGSYSAASKAFSSWEIDRHPSLKTDVAIMLKNYISLNQKQRTGMLLLSLQVTWPRAFTLRSNFILSVRLLTSFCAAVSVIIFKLFDIVFLSGLVTHDSLRYAK
jgi:hypothetical protein